MYKIALAILLSVAGPILPFVLLWTSDSPYGFLIRFFVMLVFLLVAGYFFGRGLGPVGIAGCLIGPAVFLTFVFSIEASNPPPEHAFFDIFFLYLPLSILLFGASLIAAGVGIVSRRRAAPKVR